MPYETGLIRATGGLKRLSSSISSAAVPAMEVVVAQKRLIRKTIAELNKELEPFDVEMQSKDIIQQILRSEWFRDSRRISIYVNTVGEVKTDSLIRGCLLGGKEVFIPNFERGSNQMDMIKLQSLEEFCNLEGTLWGIRQHAVPCKEFSWKKLGPLDAVILPGVAFTMTGLRLGHGKGYYDRFLAEHQKVFGTFPYTVGLALQHQVLERLPVTSTDVQLDLVLASS